MYRSATVALKPENPNEAVTNLAVQLAARQHLQYTAIAVIDPDLIAPAEPTPLGASAFKTHRDAARKEELQHLAQAALDSFARRCAESSISCSTQLREGTLASEITQVALSTDLLLLGHTAGTEAAAESGDRSQLNRILKHCARPCVVVPGTGGDPTKIAVAYDESIQAARAVHDFAVGGLWKDCSIHVVSLDADSNRAAQTAERAAAYLKLHHYQATTHPVVTRHEPAQHILDFVHQMQAGMLVMGAFGETNWRELVFGSVTRSILRAITIPVFLSH